MSLIGSTATSTGLKIRCELDRAHYPDGVEVTDEQMASTQLEPAQFHGDWNYTIWPTRRARGL